MSPFQSAPPAREATPQADVCSGSGTCFNPRLPRGRRPPCTWWRPALGGFNPRLPRGRRRQRLRSFQRPNEVSIRVSSLTVFRDRRHRMRRRGTFRDAQSSGRPEYPAHLGHVSACQGRSREAGGVSRPLIGRRHGLNNPNSGRPIAYKRGGIACDSTPRLPRGRRHVRRVRGALPQGFQSAPPAREATIGKAADLAASLVSIRASRAGGDLLGEKLPWETPCFNPRLPRGRRREVRGLWVGPA